jgi:hypothetical protein
MTTTAARVVDQEQKSDVELGRISGWQFMRREYKCSEGTAWLTS